MHRSVHIIVVVVTLLSCIGCDQLTKAVAKGKLPRNEIRFFAGDAVRLQYTENEGAFLGMGASLPEKARKLLFPAAIGAIVAGILVYLFLVPALPCRVTIGLSLVAGGGLGNLIDRIAFDGHVVDFLNIGFGNLRTGVFNVADVAITAGAILLFVEGAKRAKPV